MAEEKANFNVEVTESMIPAGEAILEDIAHYLVARREAALKRMLATPKKPYTPKGEQDRSEGRPHRSRKKPD